MRKIIFLAIFCMSSNLMAQTFEGTIKWSITSDISDPAMKAQMEQAQKQMNDPANQQKMKELKKQMEDPQFKAMMDANPKMKEQMEKTMKMMETSNINALLPTGMTVKIKGKKSLTAVEGGMNEISETLNTGDGKTYVIDREDKTYYETSAGMDESDYDPGTTVTKTSETQKILGYTCSKYIVKTNYNGQDIEQYIWATTDIKGLNIRDFMEQRKNTKQKMVLYLKEIEGVPLRMEMGAEGVKIIMEATEVKKGSIPDAEFVIPAGFKKVDGY